MKTSEKIKISIIEKDVTVGGINTREFNFLAGHSIYCHQQLNEESSSFLYINPIATTISELKRNDPGEAKEDCHHPVQACTERGENCTSLSQ